MDLALCTQTRLKQKKCFGSYNQDMIWFLHISIHFEPKCDFLEEKKMLIINISKTVIKKI